MAESVRDKIFGNLKDDKDLNIGLDGQTQYFVNTGHYALNKAASGLWYGGWPAAKITEIVGDPSTGKSLLLARAIASMHRGEITVMPGAPRTMKASDGVALLDDTEYTYDPEFCALQGAQAEYIIKAKHDDTLEGHYEWMMEKIEKVRKVSRYCPLLVINDSIAQLPTRHEKKEAMDKVDMQKAKQIHKAMRKYTAAIAKQQVVYLVANHVTQKIGVMFGSDRAIKGGKGLAFQTSTRWDLRYKGQFTANELTTPEAGKQADVYGVRFVAQNIKNKVAKPFGHAVVDVYFDRGVDPYSGLMDRFIRRGAITEKTPAKGGKSPQPAVYEFEGHGTFIRDDFDTFIIDKDVLGLKKKGIPYMEPLVDKGPGNLMDWEVGNV